MGLVNKWSQIMPWRGFFSLASSGVMITFLNMVVVFMYGSFGSAEALTIIVFSYATTQLLVNIFTFRTDVLVVKYLHADSGNKNRSVLFVSQLLDVVSACVYILAILFIYNIFEGWLNEKFSGSNVGVVYWFMLPWVVFILKQTVYGYLVACQKYDFIAMQGLICAIFRLVVFFVLVSLGVDPVVSAVVMYTLSEGLSLILMFWVSFKGFFNETNSAKIPNCYKRSILDLYLSSTLKVNDNNFNESFIPIVAEPKTAACLLLLRKAFALMTVFIKPLSTLMLGSLSEIKNRDLDMTLLKVIKINAVLFLVGLCYLLLISWKQEWLGVFSGIPSWEVSFYMGGLFGMSLMLRYSLWWVQPVCSIFNIRALYIFNGLIFLFVVALYYFGEKYLSVEMYFWLALIFYAVAACAVYFVLKIDKCSKSSDSLSY